MKITRENYEVYFIDLLDGKLSNETVDELLDFMRENPDLAEELKELENISVEPEPLPTFNYSALLKTDFDKPEVFEDACIRSVEKQLSDKEEQQFKHYISKNKRAAKKYQLFEATISEPNPFIIYDNKENLKHKKRIIPIWYAAAAVIVLASIFWFNKPSQQVFPSKTQQFALNEEISTAEIILQKTELNKIKNRIVITETIQQNSKQSSARKTMEPLPVMNLNIELAFTFETLESDFVLKTIPQKPVNIHENYPTIPEYLAQQLNKIDAQRGLQRAGFYALNKMCEITNYKLDYSTRQNGSVGQIEYNSRLLAFTIPLNTKD